MKATVLASLGLALVVGCASNPPPPPAPPPTIVAQPDPTPPPAPPPAPAPSEATLRDNHIELAHQILFDLGSDHIDEEHSQTVLRDLLALIQANPRIRRVRIEGHTDSQGAAARNLDLSNRRAASVRTYLIEHGIAPDRLESQGYGETKPIDAREIAEAWEKNRRVDFFVVSRSD